ncbi:hypothetical protein C8R47DRAFT_226609 [Mycena vitilis]|nr:hypothetical protein C8R47DRAFT_226609 [Mycena vitilis]
MRRIEAPQRGYSFVRGRPLSDSCVTEVYSSIILNLSQMYPEEHVPSVPHPSPNLLSFASPELPSHPIEHPQRVQTPEPPISTAYNPGSPQFIARTTPQNRPPLRRNIFSSESKPIPFGVEDEPISGDDFTPRAYSTIRQRKGTFTLLNDSITGQPALDMLEAVDVHTADTHDTHDAHDVTLDESSTDREDNFALNGPTLPPLSPFFALQMLLFPAYCVLVGAAIILFPVHLNTIAFPASANRPNSPTLRARLVSLAQPVIAHCLPFAAPPSAIRAFAHWATVAHLHVAIFLAALVGTAYLSLPLGVLLAAACAGQFVRAWGDFALEDGTELGGDVRQMLYQVLVAPECGFGDRDALKRVGGQYYLVRAPPTETRSEILAAAGVEDDSGSDEDLE